MTESLKKIGFKDLVYADDMKDMEAGEMIQYILNKAWTYYENKIEPVKDRIQPIEKEVSLRTIDRAWSNHIDTMDKLRTGIGLRSYASSNPLQAYVQEGYELFESMMQTISQEIVSFCMNVRVINNAQPAENTETTAKEA